VTSGFRYKVHNNCVIWDIAQLVVVMPYRRFRTTCRSKFQDARNFCLEDGADLLPRNVDKELPVYCEYCMRIAQSSFQTNNTFTLKPRWHKQMHNSNSIYTFYYLTLNVSELSSSSIILHQNVTKRAAINIKYFICIVIKDCYNPIKNIA